MLRKYLPTIQRHILEPINEHTASHWYVTGDADRSEFVGTFEGSYKNLSGALRDIGFKPNWLSSYKEYEVYTDGEWTDTGHFERSTWKYTESAFSPYQIHVTLFDLDDEANTTCIFAHYEYNWLRHPIKHYRPPDGYPDGPEGVKRVRQKLASHYGSEYSKYVDEEPDILEDVLARVKKKIE
jgi:hypothetical protein